MPHVWWRCCGHCETSGQAATLRALQEPENTCWRLVGELQVKQHLTLNPDVAFSVGKCAAVQPTVQQSKTMPF
eukprot:13779-Heterococcus_DN1.PRE.2